MAARFLPGSRTGTRELETCLAAWQESRQTESWLIRSVCWVPASSSHQHLLSLIPPEAALAVARCLPTTAERPPHGSRYCRRQLSTSAFYWPQHLTRRRNRCRRLCSEFPRRLLFPCFRRSRGLLRVQPRTLRSPLVYWLNGAPAGGSTVNYQVVKGIGTLSSASAMGDVNGLASTTLHIAVIPGDVQVSAASSDFFRDRCPGFGAAPATRGRQHSDPSRGSKFPSRDRAGHRFCDTHASSTWCQCDIPRRRVASGCASASGFHRRNYRHQKSCADYSVVVTDFSAIGRSRTCHFSALCWSGSGSDRG
jgi:hypothetical protein